MDQRRVAYDNGWGTTTASSTSAVSSQSSDCSQSSYCSRSSCQYSSPPRKSILKKRRVSIEQTSSECYNCIPVSNITDLTCADPTTRRHYHDSVVPTTPKYDVTPNKALYTINPARQRFYRSRCGTICKKLTPRYPRYNVNDRSSNSFPRRINFDQSPPSTQTPEILVKVTPENYKRGVKLGLFEDTLKLSPVNLFDRFKKCDDSKDATNSDAVDSENENDVKSNCSNDGYDKRQSRSPSFRQQPQIRQKEYGYRTVRKSSSSGSVNSGLARVPSSSSSRNGSNSARRFSGVSKRRSNQKRTSKPSPRRYY